MGRYGSENDHGKRRKNYYAASTRRDFKSSSAPTNALSSGSQPGAFSSAHPKPLHRTEKPPSEASSRPRYRDASGTSPNLLSSGIRSNSYSKDARYASSSGSYSKQSYSSFQQGHYSERNVAYGSFSNHKRESDSYGGYGSSSRESTSRDLISGPSQRNEGPSFTRDSWRAERPKLNSSGTVKSFSSPSRFNPNNIPVSSRSGLSGLMSSVTNEHSGDRYDSYNDESLNRWKSSYTSSRLDKLSRSPNYGANNSRYLSKDRGRSSGLTNSMGGPLRADPSHSKNHNASRFVDRYSRSSHESRDKLGQDDKSRFTDSLQLDSDRSMDQSRDDESDEESHSHHADERYRDEDDGELEEEDENEEEDDEEEEEDENMDSVTNTVEEPGDIPNSLEVKQESNIETDTGESSKPLVPYPVIKTDFTISVDPQYVDYPDGCIYPMTKLEAKLMDLEKEFKQKKPNKTTGGLKQIRLLGSDISEYPSYKENLQNFTLTLNDRIELIKERNLTIKKKRLSLWMDYEKGKAFNNLKRKDLEEQLLVIHPADDESRRELAAIDIRVKQPTSSSVTNIPAVETPPQTSRRGRRHGDLVTTEAEFQEILKSLEHEQDEDPMGKAKRVSAFIPDLILDPVEVSSSNFMDSNNIVHDKEAWALRIRYDFIDNFSEKEHDLFCEAFCRSPKRFGEIARYMGGIRTAEECVAHYYMTKKAMSYKFLVSQFKKKASRKSSRRKSSKPKTLLTPTASEPPEDVKPDALAKPSAEEQNITLSENAIPSKRHLTDDNNGELQAEEPAKKKSRNIDDESVSTTVLPSKSEDMTVLFPAPSVESEDANRELNGIGEPPTTEIQAKPADHPVETRSPPTHAVLGLQVEPPEVPDQKRQNSSYWSITDVNEFPHLLSTYGSKWSSIADHFPTKTATMVRNYFQRNSEKNGWNDIVAAADRHLAQGTNDEAGGLNSIDATIVVKPQRNTALEHTMNGMQVYNATTGQYHKVDEKLPHPVPMGKFQHPTQVGETTNPYAASDGPHAEKPSLNSLLSALPSEDFHTQTAPLRPEGQKPSIMSLLNNDATPVKPLESGPALVSIKSNNLSALLNAQSSPPTPLREAQIPDRRNSVKSLLQD